MFRYDPPILQLFPTVRAGVIHAAGVENPPSPEPLLEEYRLEQQTATEALAGTPLSEVESVAAWRRVFSEFGVQPTRYRNAAEALLRRLTKQGHIPSLATLVDVGNLISIRYALPVAVIDLGEIAGGITVRLATGEEEFTDLGSGEVSHPEKDEVVFVDEAGRAHARRWCWRQSRESASGPSTTEVLIVVEGHHRGAEADIQAAVEDLAGLLARHQPRAAVTCYLVPEMSPNG